MFETYISKNTIKSNFISLSNISNSILISFFSNAYFIYGFSLPSSGNKNL